MATTPAHGAHGADATKKAAMNGLAIVGFGALLIAGIFLAIYAVRYVPETLSRLSSAVILSTDPEENEETPVAPTEPEEERPVHPTPVTPVATTTPRTPTTPTTPVYTYTPPRVIQTTPNLYGRADLALVNVEAGYFRGSTFIESNEVRDGRDAAVRFTVRNIGTNVASGWRVRINVENERPVTGSGGYLLPNGTQQFTLRITDPREGTSLDVDIEVDHDDRIDESNERNNDDSLTLDIERD